MGEVISLAINRAKQVFTDGDVHYARFLCYEALKFDAKNIDAKKMLHDIRLRLNKTLTFSSKIKKILQLIKIKLFQFLNKTTESILYEAEIFSDFCIDPCEGLRLTALISNNKALSEITIFSLELIPDEKKTENDYIILISEYLEKNNFNTAITLCSKAMEKFPDNVDLKDMYNEASMRKTMDKENKNKTNTIDVGSLIPSSKDEESTTPKKNAKTK